MHTNRNSAFLKSKTEALGTALFYNFSNRVLRFPTSLIQLSNFDEDGNVWFEIKKPYKEITGMDKNFPAHLHFYKKGCTCYTTLEGIATIADKEMVETVAIKFKILDAQCFYTTEKTSSLLIALKNSLTYFFKSLYRDEPNYLHLAFDNAETANKISLST